MYNDKNIDDKLKKLINENQEIPESIRNKKLDAYKQIIDMESKSSNIKKSKYKKLIVASAASIMIGTIGIGIINPSLASGIPVIEKIFEDLNETLGIDKEYAKYAQGIGQTQTVDGVTVSIEEAVSDGHNLYLTYKIKSEEKLPRGEYKPYGETSGDLMMYNDIKIDNGGSMAGGTSLVGYYKDEYTFVGIESYQIEFKGNESPDKFNVKIKIDNIGDVDSHIEDMIKGPFKFSLNIDSKADVEVIDVRESQGEYKIRSIEVSPYSINVNIEFPKSFASNKEDIMKEVNIYDDKGERVASHGYSKEGIKFNKTRVEKNTVHDTIAFNYKEMGYDEIPEYIVIKFEDYYQSQEKSNIYKSEDGSVTEYTLPEPEEIKETKDIEFKIDLKKPSN